MSSQEFEALLEKYNRNECTPAEEKLINDWYESIGNAQSEQVPVVKAEIEQRLWSKIDPTEHRKPSQQRFMFAKIAAAIAAIAITAAIGLYFMPLRSPKELSKVVPRLVPPVVDSLQRVANTATTIASVQLPDGSMVRLKPKSEIRYQKKFDGQTREVFLVGEAFFDVKRDVNRPFKVYSAEVITQVLGTSFNVKAWNTDQKVTVAVKSGKVSVYANHTSDKKITATKETPIVLAPNQQAVYNRASEKVIREVVARPEIILPQSDLFRMNFDETPVSEIFDVLQENYGIAIEYDRDKLEKCALTTVMSDEGLFERIEVISKAINAKYRMVDGRIIIETAGCN